jgi:hypothetical protein
MRPLENLQWLPLLWLLAYVALFLLRPPRTHAGEALLKIEATLATGLLFYLATRSVLACVAEERPALVGQVARGALGRAPGADGLAGAPVHAVAPAFDGGEEHTP